MAPDKFLEQHPWPAYLLAFLAEALDNAAIPHLVWGDLVLVAHDVPVCPAVCAFIVAREDMQRAEAAINDAGMRAYHCSCEHYLHAADPKDSCALKIHWYLKREMSHVTLCANEEAFHGLLPITAEHPNPLRLQILSQECPVSRAPSNMSEQDQDGRGTAECATHPIRFLSRTSLFKLLMILVLSEQPPDGIALPWVISIGYLGSYTDDDGRKSLGEALDDGLQLAWNFLIGIRYPALAGDKAETYRVARESSPNYQACIPFF